MRVLLIHNPKAGNRKHSKKELMASLTRCGHQAFYQSAKARGWKKTFKKPVDLAIAAGGDGTVHKTAWQLLDSGLPLSILPLGTANNLARSLGFTGSVDEILQSLHCGKASRSTSALRTMDRRSLTFSKPRAADCSLITFPWQRRTKKSMLRRRKNSAGTYRFCVSCRSIIRRATGR